MEWNGKADIPSTRQTQRHSERHTERPIDERLREQHSGISVYFRVCFCLSQSISLYFCFCSLVLAQAQPLYFTVFDGVQVHEQL